MSQCADEWFQDLYKDGDINKSTESWRELTDQQKRIRWPHIMLRCLIVSTEQALYFLLATHIRPFPPFEIVMDSMFYLKRVRGHEINSSADLRESYKRILSQQLQPTQWIYGMERKHLDVLLEDCSSHEGRNLFEKLLDADIDLSYHGMLIFMDFFTRIGDVDLALKALSGIDLDLRLRPKADLLARCTNLLKLDSITHEGPSPNFRILPRILEAGVKPNLALHNLIMKNAVNLGASVVAWDLFCYMQDHDLPTDARTYLILLQDALARRDAAGLQEILTKINNREDLSNNRYLIAYTLNVIRVIHGHELKLHPSVVFSNMLVVYSRAFDTGPLKHLKIIGENTGLLPNRGQVEPDAATLAYVVQSYVLTRLSTTVVQSLFDWTEQLWSEGDEVVVALSQCPPFYDGFVSFFARSSETLPRCLQIVQLMLDRKIQPSATTWGILAVAFTKHGQFQAAGEVRDMMKRQGLRFEEKTTRLLLKLQPDADLADFASAAVEDLEERSIEVPRGDHPAFTYFRQESRFEEENVQDAVENATSSVYFAQLSVPVARKSGSTVDIDVVGFRKSERDSTEELTQSGKEHPVQTPWEKHRCQIHDDRVQELQSLSRHEDSTQQYLLLSGSEPTEDCGHMLENEPDFSLLEQPSVNATNVPHIQQVERPRSDPLVQPDFTPESDGANDESSVYDGDVHLRPIPYPERVDDLCRGDPPSSDLFLSGLAFGIDNGMSIVWARTTYVQGQEMRHWAIAQFRQRIQRDRRLIEPRKTDDSDTQGGVEEWTESMHTQEHDIRTKESKKKELNGRTAKVHKVEQTSSRGEESKDKGKEIKSAKSDGSQSKGIKTNSIFARGSGKTKNSRIKAARSEWLKARPIFSIALAPCIKVIQTPA